MDSPINQVTRLNELANQSRQPSEPSRLYADRSSAVDYSNVSAPRSGESPFSTGFERSRSDGQPTAGRVSTLPGHNAHVLDNVLGATAKSVSTTSRVYASVYSGIPVHEAMIRGISVMRRAADSWVNATQILKVAGIPKTARTRILEKEVQQGIHEKVQAGYGKYQGTWIPLSHGRELASQYGVTMYLSPIFNLDSLLNEQFLALPHITNTTGSEMRPSSSSAAYHAPPLEHEAQEVAGREANVPTFARSGAGSRIGQSDTRPLLARDGNHAINEIQDARLIQKSQDAVDEEEEEDDDDHELGRSASDSLFVGARKASRPKRPKPTGNSEDIRTRFQKLFGNESNQDIKDIFDMSTCAQGNIDTVIDAQGHTALHWACSLANPSLAAHLIAHGADINRGNFAGETPLIRAVLTTNHVENTSSLETLRLLNPSIRTVDRTCRSVLHHIALVSAIPGRDRIARLYMTTLLEEVALTQRSAAQMSNRQSTTGNHQDARTAARLDVRSLVDAQDAYGDTALNIAARVGNRALVNLLLDAGADGAKANKLGLSPIDFGLEMERLRPSLQTVLVSSLKFSPVAPQQRSDGVLTEITNLLESTNESFSIEYTQAHTRLNSIEENVRHATRSLAEKRRFVVTLQTASNSCDHYIRQARNARQATALRLDENNLSRLHNIECTKDAELGPAQGPPADEPLGSLRHLEATLIREGEFLSASLSSIRRQSAQEEAKYRQLVGLCAQVPPEAVDQMMDRVD